MLGCFNPTLGQIWTNPAVGLNFYITVKTTQHFLECVYIYIIHACTIVLLFLISEITPFYLSTFSSLFGAN